MISIENSSISCGIDELDGIEDTDLKDTLAAAAEGGWYWETEYYHSTRSLKRSVAFFIFSDVTDSTNLKALVKFIKKKKLGKLIKSDVKTNPNTTNQIVMYIWHFNNALKKYRYQQGGSRYDRNW